ncbi:MAG: cytochrome b5-like heme/steroid binding domain-containing protein [Candidatus Pacebacteria bacterium]|nr:cytochrome b5-like heme/steroid binding domain-containing protein [Candidatus Paceibacterota bacterium]
MTKNKKAGLTLGIIVLLISSSVAYSQYQENQPRTYPTSASRESINPGTQTNSSANSTDTSILKKYTLAHVAAHNTETSCWTTINGDVYDITSWISQHPGGKQAIIGLCGIDGSDAFNGQHGGQRRPASELAGFKIGTLIK